LLVAQQAKKRRCFPKEFSDTVAYWPLPKPWYGAKRQEAVIAMAALAVLAPVGGRMFLRIHRARTARNT